MQVEEVDGERILSICGNELNRLKLEYCSECGAPIGPERYHDFIFKRLKDFIDVPPNVKLCIDCARKKSAKKQDETMPPVM
jgi:RNA polymerase-binding transcription factor DksA